MQDALDRIQDFIAKGSPVAMARVVKTWRSSPRPAGSVMLVNQEGDMMGSVSGGCVEKAVVARALKVLDSGESVLVDYGVAHEDAWEVGLSCGGALSVFIQPFFTEEIWKEIRAADEAQEGRVVITSLNASGTNLLLTHDAVDGFSEGVKEQSRQLYNTRQHGLIDADGKLYFQQTLPPRPRMFMIGSAHISSELTGLAHQYGFETILIDPRDTFAKKTHYDLAPGKVHVNWPQEVLPGYQLGPHDYIVILSHDPKIDDEALKIVLKTKVAYVGALGSRKTHAKRVARLQEYGFSEEEIARIDAPIGMDIAAKSAAEIALSILSQVVKVKNS